MKHFFILTILFVTLFICSYDKMIFLGNSDAGFKSSSSLELEAKIEPDEAYSRSKIYLEKIFKLRQKIRSKKCDFDRKKIDYIVLKGDWYFIVRDTYPAKNLSFYLDYAVKINKNTGELILPGKVKKQNHHYYLQLLF